jgi:hypothetical protein
MLIHIFFSATIRILTKTFDIFYTHKMEWIVVFLLIVLIVYFSREGFYPFAGLQKNNQRRSDPAFDHIKPCADKMEIGGLSHCVITPDSTEALTKKGWDF